MGPLADWILRKCSNFDKEGPLWTISCLWGGAAGGGITPLDACVVSWHMQAIFCVADSVNENRGRDIKGEVYCYALFPIPLWGQP